MTPPPLILDYDSADFSPEPPTPVRVRTRSGTVRRGWRLGHYHRSPGTQPMDGERSPARLYIPGLLTFEMDSGWLAAMVSVVAASAALAAVVACAR